MAMHAHVQLVTKRGLQKPAHVRIINISRCTSVRMLDGYEVCMCVCIYVYVCACMYARLLCACMYLCMYICVNVCLPNWYVCMFYQYPHAGLKYVYLCMFDGFVDII